MIFFVNYIAKATPATTGANVFLRNIPVSTIPFMAVATSPYIFFFALLSQS